MRNLIWDMDALAVETWHRIERGDRRGIRLREDTLAEGLLLDLDAWHPQLTVHRFTQNAEKASGADWEWFIGSGRKWFALRIQAKRMDGMEYRQLQHEGADGDDYQYDTLIRSSSEAALPTFPYYVFFHGWPAWPDGLDWRGCPKGATLDRCVHVRPQLFGCAVAPARLVRTIHRNCGAGAAGRKVSAHLPYSAPWSWLFPQAPHVRLQGLDGLQPRWTPALQWGWDAGDAKSPRQWGTVLGGPENPTVGDTYRWHRAIEWAVSDGPTNGDPLAIWQSVFEREAGRDETLDDLRPLPRYAQLAREIAVAGGAGLRDPDLVEEVEQYRMLDRTVIISDLSRGEPSNGPAV